MVCPNRRPLKLLQKQSWVLVKNSFQVIKSMGTCRPSFFSWWYDRCLGVVALEEAGFIPAIIKGINTTIEKDLEMLNKNNNSNVFRTLQKKSCGFCRDSSLCLLLFSIISCASFPNNDYFDMSRIIQLFFDSFTDIAY